MVLAVMRSWWLSGGWFVPWIQGICSKWKNNFCSSKVGAEMLNPKIYIYIFYMLIILRICIWICTCICICICICIWICICTWICIRICIPKNPHPENGTRRNRISDKLRWYRIWPCSILLFSSLEFAGWFKNLEQQNWKRTMVWETQVISVLMCFGCEISDPTVAKVLEKSVETPCR